MNAVLLVSAIAVLPGIRRWIAPRPQRGALDLGRFHLVRDVIEIVGWQGDGPR